MVTKKTKNTDLIQSKKGELRATLRMTKLDNKGWEHHKRNVDNTTMPINSGRLCYTCMEQPCLAIRRSQYRTKFPDMKTPAKHEMNDWRAKMDKETGHMCEAYAAYKHEKPQQDAQLSL